MAYNKKITVQALSESRDSIGQDIQTWTPLGSFWAEIKTYGGKEYFAALRSIPKTMCCSKYGSHGCFPAIFLRS